MKALVTGASGFIGGTLVQELVQSGVEVHALLRKTSRTTALDGLPIQRVEGNLGDLNSLKRAVTGMDSVIHLAGVVSARTAAEYYLHNTEGTRLLAQAIHESREAQPSLKRLIYVSSLAAGGPSPTLTPRSESDPDAPVSEYGKSKLLAERELHQILDRVPVTIIRPPIVYGPRDKGVFIMIQSVMRGLMPLVQSSTSPDGKKYYSSVHVKDLSDCIVRAALAPQNSAPSGEVFYASGDGVVSYEDMLRAMAKRLGKKPFRFTIPRAAITAVAAGASIASYLTRKTYPLNWDKRNEILPDYWVCTNQKAKDKLDFRPTYDFETGIAHAIDWYKENQWL